MNERYQRVAAELARLIEDLDEIAFDELRAAAADQRGRPEDDRAATQARRALEKAQRLLSGSTD